MPREISDEEYAFLQGRRQVADFVEPIYNHPKWGKAAKRLIKEVYPQARIPDIELEDKIESRFAQEKKERDEREAAAKQQTQEARWKSERARVQKKFGFTDDGMQKLETFMQEKYIGDYEVAAEHIAAKEPKTSEVTHAEHFWHLDRQPGFEEMAKDPEGYAFNQFVTAIRKDEQRAKGQQ
jgi:hypothetical protein